MMLCTAKLDVVTHDNKMTCKDLEFLPLIAKRFYRLEKVLVWDKVEKGNDMILSYIS